MKTFYSALAVAIMIGFSGCSDGASTQNPTLTLQGETNIELKVGGRAISDPGYTANDPQDGDITARVLVTGVINYDQIGQYTVNYSVKDNDGNVATASRVVSITQNGPSSGPYQGDYQYGEADTAPYDFAQYGYNGRVLYEGKSVSQTVKNYNSNGDMLADTAVVFERNSQNLTVHEFNNNTIENTDYIGLERIQTINSDGSSQVYNRFIRVNETFINTTLSCVFKGRQMTFNTGEVTGYDIDVYPYLDVIHTECSGGNVQKADFYFANGWGEVLSVITTRDDDVTTYSVLDKNSMQLLN